jgi:hypothetical protein
LSIQRTHNADLINSILKADGIWEHIGGKETTADFEAPIDGEIHYLLVEEEGETAGLFILHPGEYGIQIHANMLPQFRGKIALQAAAEALDYAFTLDDTVYAEIGEEHKNVIRFTEKFLEPAWVKDGVHTLIARAG